MATVLGANTLSTGSYDVDNSLRFGNNTYLTATFGSGPTLATKNTFSMWFKRSKVGALQQLMSSNNNAASIVLNSNDTIAFYNNSGDVSGQLLGPRLYRDTSAWMHFVFVTDTTQGTASNRLKVYINGVLETSFNNTGYPEQNVASAFGTNGTDMKIGTRTQNDRIFEGYIAETAFVDGQALAADSFGEFDDSGNWRAIDISDLTFGNNGFYLEYKAAGTGTNSSGMGADTSGNDFHFAPTNLVAIDQTTDTCTNNFATMNPLDNFHQATAFTEGSCKLVYTSGNRTWNTASVALSSGKWYVEILKGATEHDTIGIHYKLSAALTDRPDSDAGAWSFLGGKEYDDGGVKENGSTINYAVAPSDSGDIVGMYLDLDNNKLYFAVNGAIGKINAGDSGHTGIAIPAASTLENGHYYIFGGSDNASATMTHSWNFGNPIVALSSAVSDANGFGSFEYTPSGTFDGASKDFLAICTKNLAEYG